MYEIVIFFPCDGTDNPSPVQSPFAPYGLIYESEGRQVVKSDTHKVVLRLFYAGAQVGNPYECDANSFWFHPAVSSPHVGVHQLKAEMVRKKDGHVEDFHLCTVIIEASGTRMQILDEKSVTEGVPTPGTVTVTYKQPPAEHAHVVCSLHKRGHQHKPEKGKKRSPSHPVPVATIVKSKPAGGWAGDVVFRFDGKLLENMNLRHHADKPDDTYLVVVQALEADTGRVLQVSMRHKRKERNSV